ncbi:MAG: 2-hydroxyacid dehydrogenase [Spirochaetes bacterium]|nr:2-hydroxyacid dehydrogenase [Spirochaetota bacterium]
MKIAFFDTKPYDKEAFTKLNEQYGYDIKYFKMHLNEETATLAQDYDVVCVFVNDTLNKQVIEILNQSKIQLIALRCAGYNNVDLESALDKIPVVRVPAYSPYAVAEHALALMMTLNRKTHKAYWRTKDNNFSIAGFTGFDMHGKTAGVIGTGKIGKAMIQILKGFGMNILAYDLYPDKEFAADFGIKYTDLETIYQQSHIISLHCPLTPQTHHLINESAIKKMKNQVMLINTSRGGLIKTSALIEALKEKKIGSAGLDVYEEEGEYFFEDLSSDVISDDTLARLLTFPNVLVTSHQGFLTEEALQNIAETTLENIKLAVEKQEYPNGICHKCG